MVVVAGEFVVVVVVDDEVVVKGIVKWEILPR